MHMYIKALKKVVVLILILVLVCSFLELCQRLNVYYHYWRDVRKFDDPLLELVLPLDRREYVLKKNATFVTNNGITYSVNEKRLRGKEYAYEKPKDTYRILMLGDSYLFGWGLQWKDTLTVRLEGLLNNNPIEKDKTYEVINAGVYGYNTIQELELLKKEGLKYKPDIVFLYFVMNDIEPQWNAPRHPRYEYEYCKFWFSDHLIRRINDHVAKVTKTSDPKFAVYRNRHSTLYLRAFDKETYKWKSCKRAILNLATLLKNRKIDFYVFVVPSFAQDFEEYRFYRIHSEIKKLCDDNDIKVIDLHGLFSDKKSDEFRISAEETHPNENANDIIANKIYLYLKNNG